MRKRMLALLLVSAMAVAGACSGGDDSESTADVSGGGSAGMDAPEALGDQARGNVGAARGAAYELDADGGGGASDGGSRAKDAFTTTTGGPPGIPLAEERVIKTAFLHLEVDDDATGETLREGRSIAETAGGYLLSTTIRGEGRRSGEFELRVPSERFEETLSSLEGLGKVVSEEISGEDVSQEFVDLEARLRNATAQEEVLFRLYDRSQSIADTIRVQRELEDVQLEIERLRGRLRYLRDRTDLSTISVTVTEDGAVVGEAGPFERAWDRARETFMTVVTGIIVGGGFVLPLLLLALVAYALFRIVRPRVHRPAPTPAD